MAQSGIGSVVRTALRIWKANAIPFTAVTLLIHAPLFVLSFFDAPSSSDELDVSWILVDLVVSTLIAIAVTYGVVMELQGARPSLRQSITKGVARLLPILGVATLTTIALYGGLLLLVVPGLVVMMMTFLVIPVMIVENLGVRASLQRSRELMFGHKRALFLVVLATGVGVYGLQLALIDELSHVGLDLAFVALDALCGLFLTLIAAVAYTTLRHDAEDTRVPELATAVARSVPRVA